nr:hypothetical protein [Tanacetum cinerariifolium]
GDVDVADGRVAGRVQVERTSDVVLAEDDTTDCHIAGSRAITQESTARYIITLHRYVTSSYIDSTGNNAARNARARAATIKSQVAHNGFARIELQAGVLLQEIPVADDGERPYAGEVAIRYAAGLQVYNVARAGRIVGRL